jgi:glycosyltransferase involved in cell wall biosynthesis
VKVLYVTSSLPYGPGEGFIIAELLGIRQAGHSVWIVPTRPRGPVVHEDAQPLLPTTEALGLLSTQVGVSALVVFLQAPILCLRLLFRLLRSRNAVVFAKNLSVYPKGLWLGKRVRELEIQHVHAHWGGTSATLAMIAAEVAGVPWSFTVHRWDIGENNLLRRKARSACFVRSVSRIGQRELNRYIDRNCDVVVIHMGVQAPSGPPRSVADPVAGFRILMAANFVEVKGHRHLLEAVATLRDRGHVLRVDLAGDGPLRPELTRRCRELGLEPEITFLGQLSHSRLLAELAAGRWHVMALTSIETSAGEREGIPVSLMEAMSCNVPVVATSVGGVPELLGGGAGLLVPPGDKDALVGSLERILLDEHLRQEIARRGRLRVEAQFSVERTVADLVARFASCTRAVG